MRECPNCSQQIQDEAIYCRHCHSELEPPLWLTSMRKCPYCAEWIDNELERCNYCDRTLTSAGSTYTAPFIQTSDEPEDLSQSLRDSLLAEDSEEAAAIAAAAAEFVSEEPDDSLSGFNPDETPYLNELREYEESQEHAKAEALAASAAAFKAGSDEDDPLNYEQPQSDLRRSLYEDDYSTDDSLSQYAEETQSYGDSTQHEQDPEADVYASQDQADEYVDPAPADEYVDPAPADEYVEPVRYESANDDPADYIEPQVSAVDSGIWMAGAAEEEQEQLGGTGPLDPDDPYGRSASGTEGVVDLREGASGPPGMIRRNTGKLVRIVILIAILGGAVYGLFSLSQDPTVRSTIEELIATDIPTETPIPSPTATLRPAPTLPPEATELPTQGAATIPTGIPTELAGCVPWDSITLADEGTELCAYGIIKRWWAGGEIPFIAIFSEDEGTFAIIDRTTRYPVGPDSCITATGIVEVMGGTRPNIDAQGSLEECPEGVGDA